MSTAPETAELDLAETSEPVAAVESATGRKPRSLMRMNWEDLLFMHWPVKADLLRKLLPKKLELETFDGKAWLGVVPFRMSGVGFRGLPNLPFASAFP
jgi:uncharacterized protein YqjF (DUF2071 family)